MLNLKFVILRFLSQVFTTAKETQAVKCREQQKEKYQKAYALISTVEQQVEEDTLTLEQARAEAIARVNMEYNKKISMLYLSIHEAQIYASKEHDKCMAYLEECPKYK
jgi:sensor c-di-GMP phosphodiesterase-like protein